LQMQRSAQRRVKIFFDSNDEFVTKEQIPEFMQSARSQSNSDESVDSAEEYQRVSDMIAYKYNQVDVFYGDEEQQISGTTRITRNIFAGTHDRNENAILFLENLNKIKQTKD